MYETCLGKSFLLIIYKLEEEMSTEMDIEIFTRTSKTSLVHCITNFVTVNDVANIILGSGGSPIMADELREVSEITSICDSLVLNIGTINTRVAESMLESGQTANNLKIPVVFDPVGIGASKFRMDLSTKLLKSINFSVIKGNASEIKTIASGDMGSMGVDVNIDDTIRSSNLDKHIKIAQKVSVAYKSVVIITGDIDIITDGEITYIIKNGHENMENVTGTGCMLAGLIGCFVGGNTDSILMAAVSAVALMGVSGQLANEKMVKENTGISSFRTYLIDNISKINEEKLKESLKFEIRK